MNATPARQGDEITQSETPEKPADEIGLGDMLRVLWKYKWLLISSTLATGLVAVGVTLLMPNYFTATARILPPQQSASSASMLLGQLSGIASAVGAGGAGPRSPSELYVGLLKSRTVADRIIGRFSLNDHFRLALASDARTQLAQYTKITAGRDGIISVSVELTDPSLAVKVANGYAEELIRLTGEIAISEASQRRLYFEKQLGKVRAKLSQAELAARDALATGGLVMIEGQGKSLIEAGARIRAQITAKEVQIRAMKAYAAENNADLLFVRQELAALVAELARIEGAANRVPEMKSRRLPLENMNLLRELRYQEALQQVLTQQLDAARLDEARDFSLVQILDHAVIPDRKSSPRRGSIVVTVVTVFFAVACFALMLTFFLGNCIRRMAFRVPSVVGR